MKANPQFEQLLGRPWSSDFSCIHFVHAVVGPQLPGASGKWGALLALPTVAWQEARFGDVLLWTLAGEPCHTGIFLGHQDQEYFEAMHNGYSNEGDPSLVQTVNFCDRHPQWAEGRGGLTLRRAA